MKRSHLNWLSVLIFFIIYAIISFIGGLFLGGGEDIIGSWAIVALIGSPLVSPVSFVVTVIVKIIIEAIMEAKGMEIIEDCYEDNMSWEVRNLKEKALFCKDPNKSAELYAKAKELDLLDKMSKK